MDLNFNIVEYGIGVSLVILALMYSWTFQVESQTEFCISENGYCNPLSFIKNVFNMPTFTIILLLVVYLFVWAFDVIVISSIESPTISSPGKMLTTLVTDSKNTKSPILIGLLDKTTFVSMLFWIFMTCVLSLILLWFHYVWVKKNKNKKPETVRRRVYKLMKSLSVFILVLMLCTICSQFVWKFLKYNDALLI